MRKAAVILAVAGCFLLLGASPKKPAATPAAPDTLAHPMALFLTDLSKDGARQVTFKATAVGHRFFFEEPAGVTVYRFENGGYRKEAFLKNARLAAAMKKFPGMK